jgi:ABC-type antimicrobial peptide transport system permease subunit
MISSWRFITRSLAHHWRINAAVALGVAAATAVLVGALLVGDSVRESLRRLTLERLGRIDEVLVSDRFFQRELVAQVAANEGLGEFYSQASPATLFPHTTLEVQNAETASRSSGVLIVGCDETFWNFGDEVRPKQMPGDDEIVINASLADDLNAQIGTELVARLPKGNQVPADSPLANNSDRIRGLPGLRVVDVIPARGLGRFSLRPSQSVPLVAFVSIATLQDVLDQEGKINAILVSLQKRISPTSDEAKEASRALATAFHPSFEDYGLTIKRVTRTFESEGESETIYDYFSITSDRMILSPGAEAVAETAFEPLGGQGVMTYLANRIQRTRVKAEPAQSLIEMPRNALLPKDGYFNSESPRGPIAYSMVTATEDGPDFTLRDGQGAPIDSLAEDEIILNSWAATDQEAKPGDIVRMWFFDPETTHGEAVEHHADFKVKAITPLTEPASPYEDGRDAQYDEPPTSANDPDLTPEVAGVTDQETIDDWDAPFPFDYGLVREQDEDYWDNHRTTPKAFISLSAAHRLWGSRFGRVTSFRIPARDGLTEDAVKQAFLDELNKQQETLGLTFNAVKRRQLAASSGTTPFDGLFLGLSFFIITAALLLVWLLFRLGVEQRAAEIGALLALGLRRGKASRLFMAEGAVVAACGGLIGIAVGIGYAWLMLAGLRTWWLGAITTPFLQFHWTGQSLAVGYVLGLLVSLITIAWSIRGTRKISVRRLLAGQASDAFNVTYKPQRGLTIAGVASIAIAIVLAIIAVQLGGMAQAGAFLGAGFLMLTGLLLLVWVWLKRGGHNATMPFAGGWALTKLALRNAGRNPGRSAATIGLMATASFLIVGLSSFRLAPSNEGAGGFEFVAQTAEPIFVDLNSDEEREEAFADDKETLAGSLVFGLRFKPGDDASCNNLYRSSQPRVIGVTEPFIRRFDSGEGPRFRWMKSLAKSEEQKRNPWHLLAESRDGPNETVPVVIDMNTAMYSLKPPAKVGSELELTYDDQTIRFHVVGLLENSVLQGSLLIGEADFERSFPDTSGYRYFLVDAADGKHEQVKSLLEDRFGDEGFDALRTSQVLEQLFSVQNTYLSTFQSLGALGLLLGTFGLAAVQMRNVLERRGELALLRATGFKRKRLARMVMLENVLLLVSGLATGTIAALLAVLPHKFTGDASIPTELLRDLGLMLLAVLVVGLLSSIASVRASLRVPVLAALRGE